MIELNEKASIYAEENVINVLKEAFAKVYADGYRAGYKDRDKEILIDFHENKMNSVNIKSQDKTEGLKELSPDTDVIVTSYHEERGDDPSKHFVVLLLVKSLHLKDNRFYVAELRTPHYILRLDLAQRYRNNPAVMTNNLYDRQKAMDLFKQEFPVHAEMSLKCKLYDFPISELTDGKYSMLQYCHGSFITIYFHADFSCDREIAKRNCQKYICDRIRKGMLNFIKRT